MKKSLRLVPLRQLLVFGGITVTATISLLLPGLSSPAQSTLQDSPKVMVDEVWQIVNRDYVDSTFNQQNWLAVRGELLSRNYTSKEQAYSSIREALEGLNDPYTRFMDPEQFQALKNQTSGELSGIGIRLKLDETTKALTILEPIPGSPAFKSGLKEDDRILEIDGKSTHGMSLDNASELIRGDVGTKLKLRIARPAQKEFEVQITRALIELPTVNYTLRTEGRHRIGYIRLNDFSSHAADQMRQAIQDLSNQNVEAFILDLRSNPGGLLQASIDISRMWMDHGTIVQTVDRRGNREAVKANQTALTKLPLAILVDGNSASSSEILTGALKDNRRASVVGSQTFGKALVQSVHSLSDGSGLAVTIAHYYTPNGTDISRKGITPDIKVDLTDNQRQTLLANPGLMGSKQDPQYARAVTILEATAMTKPTSQQASK